MRTKSLVSPSLTCDRHSKNVVPPSLGETFERRQRTSDQAPSAPTRRLVPTWSYRRGSVRACDVSTPTAVTFFPPDRLGRQGAERIRWMSLRRTSERPPVPSSTRVIRPRVCSKHQLVRSVPARRSPGCDSQIARTAGMTSYCKPLSGDPDAKRPTFNLLEPDGVDALPSS